MPGTRGWQRKGSATWRSTRQKSRGKCLVLLLDGLLVRQSNEFMAKMKEGEPEEEQKPSITEAEVEAAKLQKQFMEMMLAEEGSEQEKRSYKRITDVKEEGDVQTKGDHEKGANKSLEADFEKIIAQKVQIPVCNYGPDCRCSPSVNGPEIAGAMEKTDSEEVLETKHKKVKEVSSDNCRLLDMTIKIDFNDKRSKFIQLLSTEDDEENSEEIVEGPGKLEDLDLENCTVLSGTTPTNNQLEVEEKDKLTNCIEKTDKELFWEQFVDTQKAAEEKDNNEEHTRLCNNNQTKQNDILALCKTMTSELQIVQTSLNTLSIEERNKTEIVTKSEMEVKAEAPQENPTITETEPTQPNNGMYRKVINDKVYYFNNSDPVEKETAQNNETNAETVKETHSIDNDLIDKNTFLPSFLFPVSKKVEDTMSTVVKDDMKSDDTEDVVNEINSEDIGKNSVQEVEIELNVDNIEDVQFSVEKQNKIVSGSQKTVDDETDFHGDKSSNEKIEVTNKIFEEDPPIFKVDSISMTDPLTSECTDQKTLLAAESENTPSIIAQIADTPETTLARSDSATQKTTNKNPNTDSIYVLPTSIPERNAEIFPEQNRPKSANPSRRKAQQPTVKINKDKLEIHDLENEGNLDATNQNTAIQTVDDDLPQEKPMSFMKMKTDAGKDLNMLPVNPGRPKRPKSARVRPTSAVEKGANSTTRLYSFLALIQDTGCPTLSYRPVTDICRPTNLIRPAEAILILRWALRTRLPPYY